MPEKKQEEKCDRCTIGVCVDGRCNNRRCISRIPTRRPPSSQQIPVVRPEGPSCISCAASLPGDVRFCPHCGHVQRGDEPFPMDEEPTTVADYTPHHALLPPPMTAEDREASEPRIAPKKSGTQPKPNITPEKLAEFAARQKKSG